MSKRKILRGTTSVSVPVFVQSTVDGSGLTGLTSATAGLVCKYRRHSSTTWGNITLSAGTLGTWSSGGFIVDTNGPPGMYDLHLPDVVFGTGTWAIVALYGATNMVPVMMEFELDSINYQDGVRLGLTSLPNLAAGANGGLPLSVDANGRVDVGEWLGIAPNTLVSGRVDSSAGAIAANAITATAIASNAITAAKIATDAIGAAQLGTDAITSAQIAASAVTEIQNGLSTYAGGDTSGITTLLSRLSAGRATNLDNLDTTVSSRLDTATYSAGTAPTAAAIRAEMDANSTRLANLDATVSSRSTYNGADTSGTTTLLSRLTSSRATNLDNLDVAVSGVPLGVWNVLRSVTFGAGSMGEKFKSWLADLGSDNRVKVTADAHTSGLTISAVSGDTKQTGDAFARIGANGAGLTAIGDTRLANLDATVSSRSTYNGADTAGTTTLLGRITAGRATNLDNLDTTVSSRNATTPPSVAAIRAEMDANSTKLANLDATVSSRSTYAGADTAGTTTLLGRLTAIRAGLLDNLDAAISSIASGDGASAEEVALAVRAELATELARLDDSITSRVSTTDFADLATGIGTLTNGVSDGFTGTLAAIDTRLASVDYVAAPTAEANAAAIRAELTTELGRIDDTISSRATASDTNTSLGVLIEALATSFDALQSSIDTRLASDDYTAPDNATIVLLAERLSETRALLLDNLDATVSSRSTYNGNDTAGVTTLLSRLASPLSIIDGKVSLADKTGFALLESEHAAIAAAVGEISGSDLTESGIASAVRTELTTELGRLDAAVSSRSTYAGGDTAGTTTLLARLTAIRSGLLDNLDAAISTRLALADYTEPDNASIGTLATRLSSARADLLDNLNRLDTAISSRSTYNGADTVGTATLLGRLSVGRAGNLDNLDKKVSEISVSSNNNSGPIYADL